MHVVISRISTKGSITYKPGQGENGANAKERKKNTRQAGERTNTL